MTTTRAATPRPQRRSVYAALAALLALTALVTALVVLTHTGGTSTDAEPVSAPAEFVGPLTEFGSACEGLTPTLLAAQIRVSSGFRAGAVSAAGAEGYAQMMPRTWARYGHGGDPNSPRDAVRALAELDCSLLATAHARGCLGEEATRAMLAMYNAGEAAVRGCAAPATGETGRYVARVLALR